MQTLMGSRYVNDFTRYGRNFRVVAQADNAYRAEISDLGNYYVRNQAGRYDPPLATLSAIRSMKALRLSHISICFARRRSTGNWHPATAVGRPLRLLKEVATQSLPAGYGYEFSGLTREEVKSGNTAAYIFAISIIFSFLFLAAL